MIGTFGLATLGSYNVLSVELSVIEIALAVGILLFGGFVKGTIGFAVGLIAISGLVEIFPPRLALIALSIPFLMSNVVVLIEDGVPISFLREQVPFLLMLIVGLFAGVWLLSVLSEEVLYLFIAGYVVLFLIFSRFEDQIKGYASLDGAGAFSGSLSGLLGGAVSAPGPPLVIHGYLNTVDENRRVFVTGVSALFLIAHAVRIVFLANADLLHTKEILLGAIFSVPMFAGVYIGILFRPYINEKTFKLLIKILLTAIGIKLFLNGIGW